MRALFSQREALGDYHKADSLISFPDFDLKLQWKLREMASPSRTHSAGMGIKIFSPI